MTRSRKQWHFNWCLSVIDSPHGLRFPISPSETTQHSKITTPIWILFIFHLSSNLVSEPQATLILFPSTIKMFLFRTVISIGSLILLVFGNKMSGTLSKFFKSVFIVLNQYIYCHYFFWHFKLGAWFYQCCSYYYYKHYYLWSNVIP